MKWIERLCSDLPLLPSLICFQIQTAVSWVWLKSLQLVLLFFFFFFFSVQWSCEAGEQWLRSFPNKPKKKRVSKTGPSDYLRVVNTTSLWSHLSNSWLQKKNLPGKSVEELRVFLFFRFFFFFFLFHLARIKYFVFLFHMHQHATMGLYYFIHRWSKIWIIIIPVHKWSLSWVDVETAQGWSRGARSTALTPRRGGKSDAFRSMGKCKIMDRSRGVRVNLEKT